MRKTSIICTLLLVLIMSYGFSQACTSDEDCDDGLFCNGIEICVEEKNRCKSTGSPCYNFICDEEIGECIICLTHMDCYIYGIGNFCDEYGECYWIDFYPIIEIVPDTILQSRWIPLPKMLHIIADGSHFDSSSSVTFYPAGKMLALSSLVVDSENIYVIGILMPQFMTGLLDVLDISVVTGENEVYSYISVELLPFILDKQKAF